jgi:D-amino-acid oxidase
MDASPAVLGGGVSGITTGLLLALLGHRPTLYTEHRADEAIGDHRPRFASLYPAASVIPHAVTVDDVVSHLDDSQSFFEVLRQSGTCGVRQQVHYELFEQPEPAPDYAPALRDFALLPEDGSGEPGAPRRPDASAVFGWRFRTYFAETPTYLRRLVALFRAAGGTIVRRRLTPESIQALDAPVLVNCLGAAAPELFSDDRPSALIRGVLVHVSPPGPARSPHHREIVSYNYAPSPSVYPRADGSAGGLYTYPRTDRWILGGSKQRGTLDADGIWHGEPVAAPTTAIDGVDVPEPVVRVNAELLDSLYEVDVTSQPMTATFGYRFARDLEGDGVRLDVVERDGRLVAHNYGHGGAGVTLSWGSAVRVARRLRNRGVPMKADPGARAAPSEASDANRSDANRSDDALLRALAMHAQSLVAGDQAAADA